jgi:hypothetical protein
MEKTQADKAQGGLMPPWIETDEAWIAIELERTNYTAGGEESKRYHHTQTQTRKTGMNGKARSLRLNRWSNNVEHGLVKEIFVVSGGVPVTWASASS